MNNFGLKKIDIKKTTTAITLEHDTLDSYDEKDLKAIAVLLGGYNQFGRNIPIKDWQVIKSRFDEIVAEVSNKI